MVIKEGTSQGILGSILLPFLAINLFSVSDPERHDQHHHLHRFLLALVTNISIISSPLLFPFDRHYHHHLQFYFCNAIPTVASFLLHYHHQMCFLPCVCVLLPFSSVITIFTFFSTAPSAPHHLALLLSKLQY